jgi:hypothetical protein
LFRRGQPSASARAASRACWRAIMKSGSAAPSFTPPRRPEPRQQAAQPPSGPPDGPPGRRRSARQPYHRSPSRRQASILSAIGRRIKARRFDLSDLRRCLGMLEAAVEVEDCLSAALCGRAMHRDLCCAVTACSRSAPLGVQAAAALAMWRGAPQKLGRRLLPRRRPFTPGPSQRTAQTRGQEARSGHAALPEAAPASRACPAARGARSWCARRLTRLLVVRPSCEAGPGIV